MVPIVAFLGLFGSLVAGGPGKRSAARFPCHQASPLDLKGGQLTNIGVLGFLGAYNRAHKRKPRRLLQESRGVFDTLL